MKARLQSRAAGFSNLQVDISVLFLFPSLQGHDNLGILKQPLNNASVATLKQWYSLDYELYEFVLRRLQQQVARHGGRSRSG